MTGTCHVSKPQTCAEPRSGAHTEPDPSPDDTGHTDAREMTSRPLAEMHTQRTRKRWQLAAVAMLAVSLGGCGETATLPVAAGTGPNPVLPPPARRIIPTVNIAPAQGWPEAGKPVAATGLVVTAYATGLAHPRWLYVLPNGDVLVAETDEPPKPEDSKGLRRWFM